MGDVGVARTLSGWRAQWRRLLLHECSAQKDVRRDMQNTRLLSQGEVQELSASETRSDEELLRWERELWSHLGRVRKRVATLSQNVKFAQDGEVQSLVRSVEHDLHVFAEQSRQEYEDFAQEEHALDEALAAALERFEGWSERQPWPSRPPARADRLLSTPSCERLLPASPNKRETPEAKLIRAQLQQLVSAIDAAGGSSGSWPPDDHGTFLRIVTKFNGKVGATCLSELQRSLPHLTHESIIAHAAWHATYEERLSTRRRLLDSWRSVHVATGAHSTPEAAAPESPAAKPPRPAVAAQTPPKQQQAHKRQLVAEWRLDREEKRKADEAEQLRRDAEERQREAQARGVQKEQVRAALESFRQRRSDEKRLCEATKGEGDRRRTVADRQRVASRTAELLRHRGEQVRTAQLRRDAKYCFEPPARGCAYEHVQSCLESATASYVERARQHQADVAQGDATPARGAMPGNFAHQVVLRTTRSCPAWRPGFGA